MEILKMMQLIAHRGLWYEPDKKNTLNAFNAAIINGFGIETDIRFHDGRLIISHDVPNAHDEHVEFNTLLYMLNSAADKGPLAVNIKSDGLHELLLDSLSRYPELEYFVFDMSIPTLYFNYNKIPVKFYTSVNELIQYPILFNEATGVWVDAYSSSWYNHKMLSAYLESGKKICLVSPELHGREYSKVWGMIRKYKFHKNSNFSLCTDIPIIAKAYFQLT